MKKKVLGLCMVAALGITMSGCSATMEDVTKQTEKVEHVIEDGEIFEKDWAVTITLLGEDEDQVSVIKKDGDNFYIKSGENEAWIIREGSEYKVYNGATKKYNKIKVSEFDEEMSYDLKAFYESFVEMFRLIPEQCQEDGMTCEFDKTLFGKLTVKASNDYSGIIYSVRNGKILEFTMTYAEGKGASYEFDYGNQKVNAPADKDQYKEAE